MPRSSQAAAISEAPSGARVFPWRPVLLGAIGVLLAINLVFFVLLLKPAGQRAEQQRQQVEELRKQMQSHRDAAAALHSIAGNLDVSSREGSDFYAQKFLPKPTGFSIVMEEVDRAARANNVRKGSVSYGLGAVAGRPDLEQVDITTVVDGDYGNVVRFINAVERSPLFLIIDSISAGAGTTGAPGMPATARGVRLSIRLVTFFKVEGPWQLNSTTD
jgi:Tfp pilus assembly protein PilO